MSLIFKEDGHLYENIDPNDTIEWVSVTRLVGMFKPEFDKIAVSEKCSKNKRSKWFGMTPEDIRAVWDKENLRAVTIGTFYHNQRESDLMSFDTITREGLKLPIIPPHVMDGIKYAPDQKLNPGVYPEHFAYLKSAGICGQADYVEVVNGKINILDYKTNKEIKLVGYKNWKGQVDTMHAPIAHIENCNLLHYNLQMSIYLYIMLKHNPKLKPGKLTLQHVVFEKEGEDKYGYPITKYSNEGDPVVKETVMYEVPYLKEEVISMINWLKNQ